MKAQEEASLGRGACGGHAGDDSSFLLSVSKTWTNRGEAWPDVCVLGAGEEDLVYPSRRGQLLSAALCNERSRLRTQVGGGLLFWRCLEPSPAIPGCLSVSTQVQKAEPRASLRPRWPATQERAADPFHRSLWERMSHPAHPREAQPPLGLPSPGDQVSAWWGGGGCHRHPWGRDSLATPLS